MTAFDRAVLTMFANTDMAREVIYTPPGEEAEPVTVAMVPQSLEPDAALGSRALARREIMRFEVPVASLANPAKEGTITYLGVVWTINSTPTRADDERLTWLIEAYR